MCRYADAINICYRRQSASLQARVPTGLTWAIARAVTETLTPVVSQCVLNQTRGFWLLSDALAGALKLMVQMEAQQLAHNSIEPPLECSEFDSELEILYGRMAGQVAAVLRPFLAFSRKYDEGQAQNMLALMLDPRFKGLELLQDYVGREVAKKVVDEYDTKVLVPMLVKVAVILSPTVVAQPTALIVPHVSQTSLFGAPASTAEASKGLLLGELSLFRRLVVEPINVACPLLWWKEHESRFPTVAFVARQFLGIPGSQIECERIFSIAGILTSLRRCRLGTENLNALVMIQKNWPFDARTDTLSESDITQFFNDEAELLEIHEEELIAAGELE